jgi:hypothetical protein
VGVSWTKGPHLEKGLARNGMYQEGSIVLLYKYLYLYNKKSDDLGDTARVYFNVYFSDN